MQFLKISASLLLILFGGTAAAQIAPPMLNNPQVSLDQLYETGIPQARGVPAVYTSRSNAEDWMVDGYRGYCNNGPGVYTMARQPGIAPPGFDFSLSVRVVVSNSVSPVDANCHIELWLPPADIAPLSMGTPNARDFIFSWYQACPGAFSQSVAFTAASDNHRTFVGQASYTGANAFQRLWIDVPGDTAASTHYSDGLKIVIDLGFGPNYEIAAPSVAWRDDFMARVTGSFSFINQPTGTSCDFSGFQTDFGNGAPPPFRMQSRHDLLKFAQRFICKTAPQGVPALAGYGWAGSLRYATQKAGAHVSSIDFDNCGVEMNAVPVVTLLNPLPEIPDVFSPEPGAWGVLSGPPQNGGGASSPSFANTTNRVLIWNNGQASDGDGQINAISAVLMACPGNVGYGTGCQNP